MSASIISRYARRTFTSWNIRIAMNKSKQIISILKRLKSAKARDIAMELSKLSNRCFAKNIVNDILHNQLNEIVEHDDHFYWSLKPNFESIPFNCTESPAREADTYTTKQFTIEGCDSEEAPTAIEVNTIGSIYTSDLVENVKSLNSANTLSIVGIARTLQKPATVIYKILRENNLLKTNAKDTLWYKEVTIPVELRLQLKTSHITFGLWCSSLKISPVAFAKALEARLSGFVEPSDLEFAFTALNHDFPSVFDAEIEVSDVADTADLEPLMVQESSSHEANNQIPDVALNNSLPALPTSEDSHLVSILSFILHSQGLLDVGSIIRDVVSMHADTYSGHSIESELSLRPEFVMFAPGIYGLQEHLNGFGVSTSNLLLNDQDCQLYIMARYAGEVFGSFPLWTASMEYKWYQWLEKNPNTELRESFNYIASPDDWPVNKKTADELSYKIGSQDDTYYFLREPTYQTCTLPDIQSLLLLIRYVKERGAINWIAANRVLGRRVDDYTIVAHLALLVCIGVIDPAHNWQSSHNESEDASEFEDKLSNILKSDRNAAWSTSAGEFLLDSFTININTKQTGWVNVSTINKLFFDASKRDTTLISEDNLAVNPYIPAVALSVTKSGKKSITSPITVPKMNENDSSLLLSLKVALTPQNLIPEKLWIEWSQLLSEHSISAQLISTLADQNNLPWPVTKEYETLDKYLGMSLDKISKLLSWKYSRTLLLIVANTVLTELPQLEVTTSDTQKAPPIGNVSVAAEVSFDELFRSKDPIALLSDNTWNTWIRILSEHPFRTRLIADIVDDLGSLFWQLRWKDEKILNYCQYSLDELRELKYPGKNRTIVICLAKVALEAIADLDSCVTNINNNGITNLSVSTRSVNFVSTKPPKPVLNRASVEQLTDVLSSRFANGFRLNSPIELARFRLFVEKDAGEELTLSDEELRSSIAASGMAFGGKVYAVSTQAKERIRRLAEDYFTDGAQAIFFAEFYTKNESWLFEASVVSEDMLIEILRKLFPKLLFTQTYFGYTGASIVAALESEILRVWGDDVLRTYCQLVERLCYIPLERIKSVLSQNSDFIWNSMETFAHVSKIEITAEERHLIREAVSRECNSRGYASIADLPLSEIDERNYTISLTALHNAVYRICLSDKFDIKGKIVTRKGDTLDALTIMKNYCLTIDKCSLDNLLSYEKELTGEINRWIPMEAGNTVLVRIDKDHYVADKLVHFDVEAVDAAIELFIEGDYLPLISFTTFGAFPHCGQTWNLFLLESYCRRFSRKFRFDTPSINSRNAGAVIRKTCGMDYTEIMTDAVANADVPLKDTAVGKFLYENGYTGRSTAAKVNEIISNAKTMQIKKD